MGLGTGEHVGNICTVQMSAMGSFKTTKSFKLLWFCDAKVPSCVHPHRSGRFSRGEFLSRKPSNIQKSFGRLFMVATVPLGNGCLGHILEGNNFFLYEEHAKS